MANPVSTLTNVPAYVGEFDFQAISSYNVLHYFYLLWLTEGASNVTNWQRQASIAMQLDMAASGTANREFQNYFETNMIYTVNNPGSGSLQTVTPSVVANSGCAAGQGTDHYCVTWTTPAGTQYLRGKWDPLTIVDLIGFNPGTNTFSGSDSTTDNWFAANDVTPSLPPASPGNSQSVVVNTNGVTGLTASNFSIKAFTQGCGISPSSIGPYTASQSSGFATFLASNCSTSSYTISSGSLSGSGLSLNSSTGALTGTAVAGSFSFTVSYSTASVPISLTINSVPSITTSSPLPAGSVGTSYSQSLAASGGSLPLTWSVTGGTTPPGLNLSASGILSGTPTSATGSPFSFTVKVTDLNGISNSKTFSLTVTSGSHAYTATFSELLNSLDQSLRKRGVVVSTQELTVLLDSIVGNFLYGIVPWPFRFNNVAK